MLFSASTEAENTSNWSKGGANYAGAPHSEAVSKKHIRINEIVSKIQFDLRNNISMYPEHLSDLFKKRNDSWKEYVETTCNTIGIMTGSGGSWPSYYTLKCENNMADQRLFTLTNTSMCINRHIRNKEKYDIAACLYQSFSVKY